MKQHHKIIIWVVALGAAVGLGSVAVNKASVETTPQSVEAPTSTVQVQTPYGPKAGPSYLYPNPALTPGVVNPDITQANIQDNICNPNWSTKSIRPPVSYTGPLKAQELKDGYTYPAGDVNGADYELDHFISLEIGGNPRDQGNLWPEPYHSQVNGVEVGAHQKDLVENYLHKQICSGAMTLEEAQNAITSDWYAIYLEIK